ncbi:MAG: enoyl-CoA hydratase/isomerase family protein [Acidobacteriota bacterium]
MLHRDDRDGLAVLRFDHDKVHALDLDLLRALRDQLEQLEVSPARALVLTGTGSAFSAGVDLQRVLTEGDDYVRAFLPELSRALEALFEFPRPVVAAVNGHAIAGGLVLAAACDRRIATDNEKARLGLTELKVGVPFPVAALEVMRFLLPTHVVQDLVYTGRLVDTEEALSIGLVDERVANDEVLDRALAVADRLAAIPAKTFAATKDHLRQPTVDTIGTLKINLEDSIRRLWTDDTTEAAVRNFLASLG